MAVAKGIAYKDMNAKQKKRAEAWAKKWGSTPEKCPMLLKSGIIITNRKDVPHISDEDYDILTKHGVDSLDEITDEIREDYRESLKDLPSDEEMEHVKAKFAARRG